MDGTNHSRGSTLQSLSPDKREDLEHELRPEALASIAREETAEASTNTTHAAVSPKTHAETASTGRVPRDASTHTDRAVRTEASVDDKSSLGVEGSPREGGPPLPLHSELLRRHLHRRGTGVLGFSEYLRAE